MQIHDPLLPLRPPCTPACCQTLGLQRMCHGVRVNARTLRT
jgi:hypothetical protein